MLNGPSINEEWSAPRVKIQGPSMANLKKFRHAVRGSKGAVALMKYKAGYIN